jgi:serine/threonine protein kinase
MLGSMLVADGPADLVPGPGQRVGPYRLLEPLGEGSVGVVFHARREPGGDEVAVKILRDELVGDALYRRRFEREARIASEVTHEHIVPVVDFGEASGRLYIASRYVAAEPLSARIATQGTLSVPESVRLARHLAGALQALNARGLVHRDVKPANVLVSDRGAAALTDFGLARSVAETVLTKTGLTVGTVDYLAPELIRGRPAAHASDVYALGCVVYECLTGAPPFAGKPYVEALIAHVRDEPASLLESRTDLSESFSWAVLKALAKDPRDRPPTAEAYARLVRASARSQ